MALFMLGLPLGLLWESLNWRCARGWFYTVPFFERPRLFEMPLPGYLGYLPFLLVYYVPYLLHAHVPMLVESLAVAPLVAACGSSGSTTDSGGSSSSSGGGGGATRNVISCCLGNASVNNSGIRTRIQPPGQAGD